jgi:CheY-like chemotaxis protein
MWVRIRAVIIEDETLAARYLAALLDDTCQVEVVGTATESETGLKVCAELRPDAVFLDIKLAGKDGVSLATQLAMLPQPPRLVFTTGSADRAIDAFRLEAVDYLLKPLDPEQVTEAVKRLLTYLRPFESGSSMGSGDRANEVLQRTKCALLVQPTSFCRSRMWTATRSGYSPGGRLQRCCGGKDALGSIPCGEEFATYYPLADLMRWLVSCPRNTRYFVAIKMGRRQGGPSRTGGEREHI